MSRGCPGAACAGQRSDWKRSARSVSDRVLSGVGRPAPTKKHHRLPSAGPKRPARTEASSEGRRLVIKSPGAWLWAAVGCGTRPVQRYRCCRRAVAVAGKAHRRSVEGPAFVPLGGAGIEAWKSAHLFNQIVSLLPRNRLFLGGSHASELRRKADSGEE